MAVRNLILRGFGPQTGDANGAVRHFLTRGLSHVARVTDETVNPHELALLRRNRRVRNLRVWSRSLSSPFTTGTAFDELRD